MWGKKKGGRGGERGRKGGEGAEVVIGYNFNCV